MPDTCEIINCCPLDYVDPVLDVVSNRVTEAIEPRVTEEGDIRITE